MSTRLPLLRLPILVVLLALSGLLLAGAAHAAQLVPGTTPLAFEEEFAGEEEDEAEFEEGACKEAEEEFDEGELSAGEVKEICEEEAAERRKKAANPGTTVAPEECILRSAHGEATTPGQGDKLKLTIGYTTYEPTAASLKIGNLGTVHRHLGRSGVLRLVEDLHGHDGPKHLSVQIDIASAKSTGCPFRRLALSPR